MGSVNHDLISQSQFPVPDHFPGIRYVFVRKQSAVITLSSCLSGIIPVIHRNGFLNVAFFICKVHFCCAHGFKRIVCHNTRVSLVIKLQAESKVHSHRDLRQAGILIYRKRAFSFGYDSLRFSLHRFFFQYGRSLYQHICFIKPQFQFTDLFSVKQAGGLIQVIEFVLRSVLKNPGAFDISVLIEYDIQMCVFRLFPVRRSAQFAFCKIKAFLDSAGIQKVKSIGFGFLFISHIGFPADGILQVPACLFRTMHCSDPDAVIQDQLTVTDHLAGFFRYFGITLAGKCCRKISTETCF